MIEATSSAGNLQIQFDDLGSTVNSLAEAFTSTFAGAFAGGLVEGTVQEKRSSEGRYGPGSRTSWARSAPEIFVPNQSGRIIPDASGVSGPTININYSGGSGGVTREEVGELFNYFFQRMQQEGLA